MGLVVELALHRPLVVRLQPAIAYVDLCHFRDRVNAPYGHLVGDRAIQAVAGTKYSADAI